ncbi:hypothetical protein EJB05_00780, partial [Eragrostis curvula]
MHLHDDILGAILERIDSQVSLLRAASTCKRWRSSIADTAFLRRFRSLHAPAVAGDYCNYSPLPPFPNEVVPKTRDPVFFIPSPSLSSSIDGGHFSLDFLPDDGILRRVVDSRGSLLLMYSYWRIGGAIVEDLVVCEPLTRRYERIPSPPELRGATASSCFRQFYLIDGAGTSNFRVLCEHYMDNAMHIVVFNPDDDDGREYSSSSWEEKDISSSIVTPAGLSWARRLGRAAGSWYFYDTDEEDRISNMLILLDGRTGEFSSSMLPANENWDKRSNNFCVADGHDGKPRVCTVDDGSVMVFAMRDGDGQWALEKRLLLEEAIRGLPGYKPWHIKCLNILTRGPGFIILSLAAIVKWTVSVDLETMEVTPGVEDMGEMVYRCELPWPPVLNACVDSRP